MKKASKKYQVMTDAIRSSETSVERGSTLFVIPEEGILRSRREKPQILLSCFLCLMPLTHGIRYTLRCVGGIPACVAGQYRVALFNKLMLLEENRKLNGRVAEGHQTRLRELKY
jgi:hypothetical protein